MRGRHRSALVLAVSVVLGFGALGLGNLPAQAIRAARASSTPARDKLPRVPTSLARRYPLELPPTAFNYSRPPLPRHLRGSATRRVDNTPVHNRVTDRGATLGRVLFHDKRLSKNERISCASCHQQQHGFSDPRALSVGFAGGKTKRNSMGLANARYHPNGRFFWDERARTLEDQVLMPIQDKLEMGMTLDEVIRRLQRDPRYGFLMKKAFGSKEITVKRISRALAQFVRSIVSYRTRFDAGLTQVRSVSDDFPNFTKVENEGKALFLGERGRRINCASCHMAGRRGFGRGGRGGSSSSALFVSRAPTNNGLDEDFTKKDTGVGGRTLRFADQGKFKVPSLRNIELTAPYMHDGRLATLEDVIDHYDRGVKQHPTLDRRLRGRGGPRGLGGPRGRRGGGRGSTISRSQKAALIAFLKTLTDHELVKDPKYSDPFRSKD